jgi:hypothetical protein
MSTLIPTTICSIVEEAAKAFYTFAKDHRFGPRTRFIQKDRNRPKKRVFVCELHGITDHRFKGEHIYPSKQRKRKTIKQSYPFKVIADRDDSGK